MNPLVNSPTLDDSVPSPPSKLMVCGCAIFTLKPQPASYSIFPSATNCVRIFHEIFMDTFGFNGQKLHREILDFGFPKKFLFVFFFDFLSSSSRT